MDKLRTVIRPASGFSLNMEELRNYRELFYFFTWRDIKVKYKQTYLGVAWALIQPLALMLLFTFVLARNFQVNTGGMPYEIFSLSGLILWNLAYSSIAGASESMIQQSNIIKKIYFPRLIIPCSSVLTSFFDFLLAFTVFLIFCLFYRQPVSWEAVYYFPLGILLVLMSAFGIGTFLSALNVQYRDFRYVVPFLLQLMFFGSQVIYPLNNVQPEWLRWVLGLNPVNGAIELFRHPLGHSLDPVIVLAGFASAFLFTFTGLIYFRKSEAYFADLA
jgi:lipopolysaccharide transport system permease protein